MSSQTVKLSMPTDDQQDYAEDPVHDGESLKRPISLIPGIESDSYPLFPQPRTEGDSTRKKQIVKFCVFTVLLSFLVIGRAGVPENEPACVVDRVHELLSGLHSSIVNSPLLGSSLLIVFSVFMDFVFLATGWNWIFRGNSSRLIIATLLFYAIKLLMQPMWSVRAPVGYTWENPGFPSLVVSYGKATEFYYSGYIGLLVICACEWKKNGNAIMTRIIRLGAVAATIILLANRANYFIDIFGGAYFAHYIFNRVDQYVEPLDKAVLRIHSSVKRFITCE